MIQYTVRFLQKEDIRHVEVDLQQGPVDRILKILRDHGWEILSLYQPCGDKPFVWAIRCRKIVKVENQTEIEAIWNEML